MSDDAESDGIECLGDENTTGLLKHGFNSLNSGLGGIASSAGKLGDSIHGLPKALALAMQGSLGPGGVNNSQSASRGLEGPDYRPNETTATRTANFAAVDSTTTYTP